MRFQPVAVKCNMMQLTKKHNKIQASYTLEIDMRGPGDYLRPRDIAMPPNESN